MDIFTAVIAIATIIAPVIFLWSRDCDLTLLWNLYMGKKTETLKGKIVWITGCSSGIGEAVAYHLATAGCHLVLSARREDLLNKVKDKCISLSDGQLQPSNILVLPLDLLKYDSHAEAASTVIKYFKKIDMLVNNAGRSQRSLIRNTPLQVDQQVVDLDLIAPISLTKAVLPHMVSAGGGHILVTSSVAGKLGAPGSAIYSAAKHGIQGFFDTLRIEYAPDNISVTMACPGPVFSDALLHAFTETPDKKLGIAMDTKTWKRMTAARCAELMAVAAVNKLDEVWLSPNPELFYCYMFQYIPYFARKLAVTLGQSRANKVKHGQHDLH